MERNEGTTVEHATNPVGNLERTGGREMNKMEKEENKVRCFVCGRRVDLTEIVVMSVNAEDMVCVCRDHIKFRILAANDSMENHTTLSASA